MKTLLIATTLLALFSCGTGKPDHDRQDTLPTTEVPTDSLSLDEAIGQMLLVGFRGTEVDSTHHIWRDIKDYHVGSVILFDYDAPTGTRGRNIKSPFQLRSLCATLRSLNPRLLIGVDQEGGYVSRLSPRYGFPKVLSARSSAALGLDSVRSQARMTAQMLAYVGINLNFAPVADVDVNPQCPVIGAIERSFSPDTGVVAACCQVWIDEQRRQGVVSCLKHFPGHGSARGDTHRGLVDVTATWQLRELAPYRSAGLDSSVMVMTAHVVNRRLDPSGLPASLSPKITSFLRDSIGFRGVIVTDDLAMGAIVGQYSFDTAVRMAVLAGADMLCLSNNGGSYNPDIVPHAVEIIKKMLRNGDITEERIRQSANRIQHLRTF